MELVLAVETWSCDFATYVDAVYGQLSCVLFCQSSVLLCHSVQVIEDQIRTEKAREAELDMLYQ